VVSEKIVSIIPLELAESCPADDANVLAWQYFGQIIVQATDVCGLAQPAYLGSKWN
jgi:hypothetical protein